MRSSEWLPVDWERDEIPEVPRLTLSSWEFEWQFCVCVYIAIVMFYEMNISGVCLV